MTISAREVWERMKEEHRPPMWPEGAIWLSGDQRQPNYINDDLATLALVGKMMIVMGACDADVEWDLGDPDPLTSTFLAYSTVFLQESSK